MSVEAPSFTPTPSNESEQPLNYWDDTAKKFVFNEDTSHYTREAAAAQLAQSESSVADQPSQSPAEQTQTPVETVPSHDNEELSGWEKIQEHAQLRDLETQFAAPEAVEPQETTPSLSDSGEEKPVHPQAMPRVELTDSTPEVASEQAVDYDNFMDALKEMTPEKVTVTSEDSAPQEVIVQKPAASEFQSVARYDDEIHADRVARERGPSLKERMSKSLEKIQSTEHDGILLEKIREAREKLKKRKKIALKRTLSRILNKMKARYSAQETAGTADQEELSRMEQLYTMKEEMDTTPTEEVSEENDIYAQIQARIEERKAEKAEGQEVTKRREPGFLRRIGKAAARHAKSIAGSYNSVKNYVGGVYDYATSPIKNAHAAGVDNARASKESINALHVEA